MPSFMDNNLGKILQNLPPQLRNNPAALAQIMNGNPLFGLHGMPNPAMIGHPLNLGANPCDSDDDDKTKIQDSLREQQKGLLQQHQQQQQQQVLINN
jgi:hypothetical protein